MDGLINRIDPREDAWLIHVSLRGQGGDLQVKQDHSQIHQTLCYSQGHPCLDQQPHFHVSWVDQGSYHGSF